MPWLPRIFGPKGGQFPVGEVIPIHWYDDKLAPGNVIGLLLYFDSVLRPDLLHQSLCKLLERGEWKKLGGRLRRNKHGRLEVHIPKVFAIDTPAVRYSNVTFDGTIQEHPLAARLPMATGMTGSLSAYPYDDDFRPLIAREDALTDIEQFLVSNEPQLALHITSFRDATLVGLSFLHTVSDMMGIGVLLKAWSSMLSGREEEIPANIGAYQDAMLALATQAPDIPLTLPYAPLRGIGKWVSIARIGWRLLSSGKQQQGMIRVHQDFIAKLKQEAIEQLVSTGLPDNFVRDRQTAKPFITDGDVLMAWLLRFGCHDLRPSSRRVVAVGSAVDIRTRVPVFPTGPDGESDSVFVGNALVVSFAYMSAAIATEDKLSNRSAIFRSALTEQTNPPQIMARVRDECHSRMTVGKLVLRWPTNTFPVLFTNWTKARIYEMVDFSSAAACEAGPRPNSQQANIGQPSYLHHEILNLPALPYPLFIISGKDSQGFYWIQCYVSTKEWESIEDSICSREATRPRKSGSFL